MLLSLVVLILQRRNYELANQQSWAIAKDCSWLW